jgi:hypothetical protein
VGLIANSSRHLRKPSGNQREAASSRFSGRAKAQYLYLLIYRLAVNFRSKLIRRTPSPRCACLSTAPTELAYNELKLATVKSETSFNRGRGSTVVCAL